MTLTRLPNTPSAGRVTYRLDMDGLTAHIDGKFDRAARYFFNLGDGDHGTEAVPRTFADLSQAEKRKIVAKRMLDVPIDASKSYRGNTAAKAASDAEIAIEESEIVSA